MILARAQTRPGRPPHGRRTDVQGLRAFAVLVVFLEHLLKWPSGGFVGVDIFFVISGFLITGLLLKEYAATGGISFWGFYRARIKRIIPAATLVIAVTVGVSHILFLTNRSASVLQDGIWSFFFSANWRFAAEGTDYFAAGQAVSPLQHYWSLSVEEQFYFVWPWLLLAVLAVVGRFHRGLDDRSRRWSAGIAIGIIIAVSFAWAMVQSTENPTVAYFSTFTRAWELGAGALLAVVAPVFSGMSAVVRSLLAWSGIGAMTASVFLLSDSTPFPAPGALLPTLGAAAVLASGVGEQARFIAPLTNPVSRYIGDISYSLYLWHFPAVIFGAALFPDAGSAGYIGVVVVAFGVAALAYHLFEKPLHRSPLMNSRGNARRGTEWRDWVKEQLPVWKNMRWVGLGATVVSVAVIGTLVYALPPTVATDLLYGRAQPPAALAVPEPAASAPSAVGSGDAAEVPSASGAGPQQQALTAKISAALQATSWPEGFENSFNQGGWPEEIERCAEPIRILGDDCIWGDGDRLAIILGDSTSVAYTSALRDILNANGFRVQGFAMNGCEYSDTVINNASVADFCPTRKQDAVDAITTKKPDLVFVTNAHVQHTPLGASDPLTGPEWISTLQSGVEKFSASAGKVVFLAPAPADVNVSECYTALTSPSDCAGSVTASHKKYSAADETVAAALGGVAVESASWFCVQDLCPAFVEETPTKGDRLHVAPRYVDIIEPAMEEALRAAGIF